MTDVVVGDPVFFASLTLSESSVLEEPLGLCFQIHGEEETNYNLLTTPCTSVTGRWTAVTSTLNVITSISVSVVSDEECTSVHVNLDSCTVIMDGDIVVGSNGNYTISAGVSVSRMDDSLVEISVPNCEEALVLRVLCETRRVFDHETKKHRDVDMLKFSVTRSVPGAVPAHGLFGS